MVDNVDELEWQGLPWKESLGRITGLQELHMDIFNWNTDEQNSAFVKEMRSRMVVGGEQMGTEDFTLGELDDPSFLWLNGISANSLLTTSRYTDMEENHDYWHFGQYAAESHSRKSLAR